MTSRPECVICSEKFKTPKVLPCGHSFCAQCLQEWASSSKAKSSTLSLGDNDDIYTSHNTSGEDIGHMCDHLDQVDCPECRSCFNIPDGGIHAFPTNVALLRATEPDHSDCSLGPPPNEPTQEDDESKFSPIFRCSEDGLLCGNCEVSDLIVVKCLDCNELLCAECRDLHQRVKVTRKHNLLVLGDTDIVPTLDVHKYTIYKPCSYHGGRPLEFFCNTCTAVVCATGMNSDHRRHDRITLDEKAEDIQGLVKEDLKVFEENMEHVDSIHTAWINCNQRKLQNSKQVRDIIEETRELLKSTVDRCAEDLLARLDKDDQQYNTMSSKMLQDMSAELSRMKKEEEEVEKFMAEAAPLDIFQRCDETRTRLQKLAHVSGVMRPVWNKVSLHSPSSGIPIQVSKLFGDIQSTSVSEIPKPKLLVSFNASTSGDNMRPNTVFDVVISPQGYVIVADRDNRKVKAFTKDGHLVKESKSMLFREPIRMSSIPQDMDNIAVVDFKNSQSKIVKWNIKRNTTNPLQLCGVQSFGKPYGVSYSSINRSTVIVVADSEKSQMIYYDSEGKEVQRCKLNSEKIRYIAGHPNNDTVVVNHNRKCLRAYCNGKEIWSWGVYGAQYGGLCMTSTGHVIVAEKHSDKVTLLSPHGKVIHDLITGREGIHAPRSLACDECQGLMAITEEDSGSISLYQF